jgi:hypothetical protein
METIIGNAPRWNQAIMPALPQNISVGAGAVVIALLLVYALLRVSKHHDPRLLIMLVGGVFSCLMEGFACYLIHCYHSEVGQYMVYQAFGIHVPLWLAEVYIIFFGGATYFLQELFTHRPSAGLFWGLFAAIGICEGTFEMYTHYLGMFQYWGPQPLPIFGFPLYLGFVNAAEPMCFAFLACLWFREVKSAARYLLPLLTAPILIAIYGMLVVAPAAGIFAGSDSLMVGGTFVTIILAITIAAMSFQGFVRLRQ